MKNYLLFLLMTSAAQVMQGQDLIAMLSSESYDNMEKEMSPNVQMRMDDGSMVTGPAAVKKALKESLQSYGLKEVTAQHTGSLDTEQDYHILRLSNHNAEEMRIFVHVMDTLEGRRIKDIKLRRL